MTVAIYARVSSDSQEARGTVGSQLAAVRHKLAELGHHVVHEYLDEGCSGGRDERPGLDALRDAAEAGLFEQVWCLTPDRLARSRASQGVDHRRVGQAWSRGPVPGNPGDNAMSVAIYARVSSESQEARGTIGSQLEALRQKMSEFGHQVVHEYTDDGYSGARLDRPGLDALRDAAEAGLFKQVWCLTPDRLARSYAYQILITDELARHGVQVQYLDAPPLDDDPEATLLVQVQGVIAEYERNAEFGISLVMPTRRLCRAGVVNGAF